MLEEVALYEVSLVTFPANAEATVHKVKCDDEREQLNAKADWSSEIRNGDFIRLAEELERAIATLKRR